jgi:hypothetical protein
MGGKWFANRGQIVQTLAATAGVAIAGIGLYFVLKSNHALPQTTATLFALIALALLAIGIWIGRLSKPTQRFFESEKSEPKDKAEVPAIGGSARIGDINVYTHPPATPVQVASEPEEKMKPRIIFLGAEYIEMNEGVEHRGLYRVVGVKGDGKGIIASFRNDDAKVAGHSIRAHLRFRDETGKEIGTGVSGPFWLDKGTEIFTLRPDESGAIVVLLDLSNQGFIVPWIERRNWRGRRNAAFVQSFQWRSFPRKVEIRLRDQDGDSLLDEPVVLEILRDESFVTVKQAEPYPPYPRFDQ